MAGTYTYPGVYIEEIPSQVRTIVGVATSITAFLGRARKGPVNDPTRVQNFGEFERRFGPLWVRSTMSYAIQQYFQNGGADAIIVRLVDADGAVATAELDEGGLTVDAASAGDWGNRVRVTVSVAGTDVTITLEEVDVAGSSTPVILNSVEVLGTADDPVDDENDIAHVTGTFPDSAIAATYLSEGSTAATAATVALPVTSETLALEAATAGTGGNDITATVIHSTTDEDRFALLISDGVTPENYEDLVVGDLAAALGGSLLVNMIGSAPSARPDAVEDAEFSGGDDDPLAAATLDLSATTSALNLEAANEGEWGNNLQATVDSDTADPADTTLFNLTIEELNDSGNAIGSESFRNLVVDDEAARYVLKVLEVESRLVSVSGAVPVTRPVDVQDTAFAGGDDGGALADADYQGSENDKTGMYALEDADLFNLLCIPPIDRSTDLNIATWSNALAYCKERRAMLIVDPPATWTEPSVVTDSGTGIDSLNIRDENAIVYFPRIRMADPLQENRLETFVPCGVAAGVIARTDANRGVWKAPAGIEATMLGVREFTYKLTDGENGLLNPIGVNCLRTFPVVGNVMWGARTTEGADRLASEWKYVPVRRLALNIEESLFRGTQWVVFEPNDAPLWAQIRLNVGTFMQNLFRQGAFQGSTPREAYFVKCDSETTTQADIDLGIVNVVVGFAPLKPAEFVVIKLQQMAGQSEG